jgi:hypothetical protein
VQIRVERLPCWAPGTEGPGSAQESGFPLSEGSGFPDPFTLPEHFILGPQIEFAPGRGLGRRKGDPLRA